MANNNVNLTSTTQTTTTHYGNNSTRNTVIDRVSSVQTQQGDLSIKASGDVNLDAALLVNQSKDGKTVISAGHDANLSTLNTSKQENTIWSNENYRQLANKKIVGTQIVGQGDVSITAGNDIRIKSSSISSDKALNLAAGGDVAITSSEERERLTDHQKIESSGFLSSSTETTHIEVENNFMATLVIEEFNRDYNGGLLLYDGDETKALEYANGMIQDRAIAAGVVTGVIVGGAILPNSAIIGGSLSGAINAGMQYTLNDDGSINWTDVGIASGVGAVTGGAGTGFWGTVGWNAAGGATSNYLKDEDPLTGAAAGAVGAGFGYLGGKLFQGPLEKLFNPVSKQYEWVPIGVWTITKPAASSSIPAISGSAVDSLIGGAVEDRLNNYIEQKRNENK